MRVVLVGDIGWRDLYHLGDEAMTEVALDELQRRGITDITLIGGHPESATARYGVPSIHRIGFRGTPDRSHNIARHTAVTEAARGVRSLPEGDSAGAVIEAVREADAVLVAGGGNLNSFFPQHIFERASLGAVAAELGRPYAFTSQTVGPLIRRQDRPHLEPLLGSAVAFGARERTTFDLVGTLGAAKQRVALSMDDAFGLRPREADVAAVARHRRRRHIVASFAENPSTPVIGKDAYYRLIGRTLVQLADLYDADVLLVPHAGTFEPGGGSRDQISNEKIAGYAGDDRVQPLPMLTAREVAALTRDAALVTGTRYHPAIIAASEATPALSIAPTQYSSVRMRGAAANVGMQDYVLGLASWQSGEVLTAARELLDADDAVRAHLRTVAERRTGDHKAWWDALVRALDSGRPLAPGDYLPSVAPFTSPGTWATAAGDLLDATERYDRERMVQKWRIDELEGEVRRLSGALAKARQGNSGLRRWKRRLARFVPAAVRTRLRRPARAA
ncbi:polysaccharide pyruvyl transferase family protein [Streptomyces triticagri]|uniref:Polysaccharide pyruvyl transferase family protein n=1 Tax=Streptomyces triticagri TaxID=2293568 RepID=A0A372M8C3_9ACTN|nr:polysaccharide pyruvyl transferase family protein [Streptomyces triticagri]RFU87089.1 polysaccharide pyruvyl transferase family protein [Streptomyces triticagri]